MIDLIRKDYFDLLNELGRTEKSVLEEVETTHDVAEILSGTRLGKSEIQGIGCFAEKDYEIGDAVCVACIASIRTLPGRYINHSPIPNVQYASEEGSIIAYAVHPIKRGDEITVNYRQAIQVAHAKICPVS